MTRSLSPLIASRQSTNWWRPFFFTSFFFLSRRFSTSAKEGFIQRSLGRHLNGFLPGEGGGGLYGLKPSSSSMDFLAARNLLGRLGLPSSSAFLTSRLGNLPSSGEISLVSVTFSYIYITHILILFESLSLFIILVVSSPLSSISLLCLKQV